MRAGGISRNDTIRNISDGLHARVSNKLGVGQTDYASP